MSRQGVHAARQLVGLVSDIVLSLSPQEWQRPSGCTGWRVQDVIAHLGSGAHSTLEPSAPRPELTAEQQMEEMVDARRDWSSSQVAQEYLDYAMASVDLMAGLQEQSQAELEVPLLDLGTYPLGILPDVVTFDHYCHLYVDVLAPFGPVERSVPEVGDEILQPAIGWMLAGLPQMQRRELDVLITPLVLHLTGPGGGAWLLSPANADAPLRVRPVSDRAAVDAPVVESRATDFVRWATQRADWRHLAVISGQRAQIEPFLDRLNII